MINLGTGEEKVGSLLVSSSGKRRRKSSFADTMFPGAFAVSVGVAMTLGKKSFGAEGAGDGSRVDGGNF